MRAAASCVRAGRKRSLNGDHYGCYQFPGHVSACLVLIFTASAGEAHHNQDSLFACRGWPLIYTCQIYSLGNLP